MERDKGNKEVVAVWRNQLMLEHLFLIGQPDALGGVTPSCSEWLTGVSL